MRQAIVEVGNGRRGFLVGWTEKGYWGGDGNGQTRWIKYPAAIIEWGDTCMLEAVDIDNVKIISWESQ